MGATLYQTNFAMLTQLNLSGSPLSFSEQFGIAFWVFGVPTWVMLSITLYLIERKKPKEKKSNFALWMGIVTNLVRPWKTYAFHHYVSAVPEKGWPLEFQEAFTGTGAG